MEPEAPTARPEDSMINEGKKEELVITPEEPTVRPEAPQIIPEEEIIVQPELPRTGSNNIMQTVLGFFIVMIGAIIIRFSRRGMNQ